MINDYYQEAFRPAFPVEMLIALSIIFTVAILTGVFYKKEHKNEIAENMIQTIAAMIAVMALLAVCYYDGIVQLLANILRANTDTSILYVDFVACLLCSAFSLSVGAGYMAIKKRAYIMAHANKM